ncbi:GNAT family N-acetyltransferase [Solwaraspora sp. WMMD406]|uniref:GNAT family N-acetyltransferase n=1 Tax=Solwaraspora sp. WMMD406 TaxID=3016095 RepID=UPI002415AE43|nr:GNAT family N-acetyltransferase [Solwaraspora sp. WMMD406]MDG4765395.1 GNAT family N-acetyltransferase [Solwaraspora sp. WMMD406]
MANQENELLDRLDRFCDAVPRSAARPEELGNYVLFVREGVDGWPFYARPRRGASAPPAAADITTVRARQRELGVPESFEWIHEVRPDLLAIVRSAGLGVHQAPLMVLDPARLPPADQFPDVSVRLLDPTSSRFANDVAAWYQITRDSFGATANTSGTLPTVGTPTPELVTVTFPTVDSGGDRDQAGSPASVGGPATATADPTPSTSDPSGDPIEQERLTVGSGARAIALGSLTGDGTADLAAPVATGAANRVDDVAEIVGVGTLPAARRRGLGAAVTTALARHALDHGVALVFLAAGDDNAAVIYHRLGFRRVGTACVAEPGANP